MAMTIKEFDSRLSICEEREAAKKSLDYNRRSLKAAREEFCEAWSRIDTGVLGDQDHYPELLETMKNLIYWCATVYQDWAAYDKLLNLGKP